MIYGLKTALLGVGVVGASLLTFAMITKFELPPNTFIQGGFRGVAMGTNYNNADLKVYLADNRVPASLPQLPATGPKASAVYKNVQVLGDLSIQQFGRLMQSITEWVSPEVENPEPGAPQRGCNYCHNPENYAEDSVYTKVVSRRMLQMVKHINEHWTSHVGEAGVTCYTCHRGNPVPAQIWFHPEEKRKPGGMAMVSSGQNTPSPAAGLASLPTDPFTPYLENNYPIRVQGASALPQAGGPRNSIKEAEWTWSLMVHYSQSLGVNCTYCHNTRAFSDWQQSAPARQTAYYAAPMVRDLNANYLKTIQDVFPPHRLGPTGDVAKINCGTCHQGVYKPLFGANMINDYPELLRPTPEKAAAMTPATAPAEEVKTATQ